MPIFRIAIAIMILVASGQFLSAQENKSVTLSAPANDGLAWQGNTVSLPKPKIMDILPPQDIVFFDYIFQPTNKIRRQDDHDFDLHEFRTGFDPMLQVDGNVYAGVGVLYTAYNFRFAWDYDDVTGTRINGHDETNLHALSFPITLAWIGDEWMMMGRIEPGIKSDFHRLNRHDAQVNGSFLVGHLFDPDFLLEVGIALTNDWGDLVPVPLIGCEWKIAAPYLDFSALLPISARLNLHPFELHPERLTAFLFYELDGDQFRFRYHEAGQLKEEDVQFTFYRLGFGVEFALAPGALAKIVLGGTAEGEYEFRGLAIKDKGRIDGTFFMMISITVNDLILGKQ